MDSVSSLWQQLIEDNRIDDIIASIDANCYLIHEDGLELPKTYGIYIFYIQPSVAYEEYSDIQSEWAVEGFVKCPKIIKSPFRRIDKNSVWIPFYIGKAENISKRVSDHLHHKADHQTYGMKLLEREEFLNKKSVQSWILGIAAKR